MNQNQTVDNDLQKAIDDITNNTNTDPVFSDPIAAPSTIPEGDTGELGEPIGPFPEPKVEMVAPETPQLAPLDPINIPDLNTVAPVPNTPATPPVASAPMPTPEPTPTFQPAPQPNIPQPAPLPPAPAPEVPAFEETITEEINTPAPAPNLSTRQVKEAALRDLIPLLDRLNMTPSQRFNICRNIFEDLRDYTVLDQAYRAASEITDPSERAESLLYLVESIDKM